MKIVEHSDFASAKTSQNIELRLRKERVKSLLRDRQLYYMLIPFLLWYLVFLYKPMYGLQIAFKDFSLYRSIADSPWIGLEHFKNFFNGPYFYRTVKNTFLINVWQLVFSFPIPIILALLLNEVRHTFFKRTVQTLTYLPHFISVVVVAGFVTNFLSPSSGIVNILIKKFGGESIYFLTIPEYFRWIYVLSIDVWKDAGFSAIIYIAALSAVDPSLYEAARMDGANRWKQAIHVTLPAIMPTIAILLILKIGGFLEIGHEAIILLYQPVTYETADVISTYVYRAGLVNGDYAFATAVGLFNGIVALILVWFANAATKKLTNTGLW